MKRLLLHWCSLALLLTISTTFGQDQLLYPMEGDIYLEGEMIILKANLDIEPQDSIYFEITNLDTKDVTVYSVLDASYEDTLYSGLPTGEYDVQLYSVDGAPERPIGFPIAFSVIPEGLFFPLDGETVPANIDLELISLFSNQTQSVTYTIDSNEYLVETPTNLTEWSYIIQGGLTDGDYPLTIEQLMWSGETFTTTSSVIVGSTPPPSEEGVNTPLPEDEFEAGEDILLSSVFSIETTDSILYVINGEQSVDEIMVTEPNEVDEWNHTIVGGLVPGDYYIDVLLYFDFDEVVTIASFPIYVNTPISFVTVPGDQEICIGDDVTVSADFDAEQVEWVSSGDGTFPNGEIQTRPEDQIVYKPGDQDITRKDFYLTAFDPSGASAEVYVYYSELPETFTAGEDGSVTGKTPYQLMGVDDEYPVEWVSSGGGQFSDSKIATATYTPDQLDIDNGVVFLIFNITDGCPNTRDTLILTVLPEPAELPNLDAGAAQLSVCAKTIPLKANFDKGTATWTTLGNGKFFPSATQKTKDQTLTYGVSPEDIVNGAVALVVTLNDNPTVKDTIMVTLQQPIVINAGVNHQQSGTTPFKPTVTVLGTTAVKWTTTGTGTFSPSATTIDATYNPSEADKTTGLVKLTLKSENNNNCPTGEDALLLALTDCDIYAKSTIVDNEVTLTAVNSNKKILTAYSWDFGDGNKGRGLEVSHIYSSTGDFTVTCNTKTSAQSDFCKTSYDIPVTISSTSVNVFSVSGTINVSGSAIDQGVVSLFYIAPNGTFELAQEKLLNASDNGNYTFTGLRPSKYFIIASPTPSSTHFVSSFPTFYGDASDWLNASPIELTENQTGIDVSLETFTPANSSWDTGEDLVNGIVTFDETFVNKAGGDRDIVDNPVPVESAVVTLFDTDGNLLAFTTTDEFGEFNFADLETGVYELRIEYVGTSVSLSQEITIDGDNQTIDQFSFKVGQDEGANETGLFDFSNNSFTSYSIYPNPAEHIINIQLPTNSNNQEVTYSITSTTGTVVRRNSVTSAESLSIDVNNLKQGVYIIQVSSDIGNHTYKFSKK